MRLEAHRVVPDRFSRPPVVSTVEPPAVIGPAEPLGLSSGRRLTIEAPVEPPAVSPVELPVVSIVEPLRILWLPTLGNPAIFPLW